MTCAGKLGGCMPQKNWEYLDLTGSDLVRINGDKITNLKVKSDS